ncbi:MAG: RNA polymerase sigma factor [Actinomycetota bacterium]
MVVAVTAPHEFDASRAAARRAQDDADFPSVLGAAQSGAKWAVGSLFRFYHPKLLAFLRYRAAGESEDLASEIWLDVAAGLRGFRGTEAAFRAWMFTIAGRALIDHRRRAAKRHTDPVPEEWLAYLPAPDNPEAQVLDAVSVREALALLDALPPQYAEVLTLRVVGGLDVSGIAAVLGKRPGAVRVLQHRAFKRLGREITARGVTRRPRRRT